MLRHSRAMTRHHRERVIAKTKKELDAVFWRNYDGPLGKLSKHSMHHNSCWCCHPGYERAKSERQWRRQLEY